MPVIQLIIDTWKGERHFWPTFLLLGIVGTLAFAYLVTAILAGTLEFLQFIGLIGFTSLDKKYALLILLVAVLLLPLMVLNTVFVWHPPYEHTKLRSWVPLVRVLSIIILVCTFIVAIASFAHLLSMPQ